jgi:hypothetical protein
MMGGFKEASIKAQSELNVSSAFHLIERRFKA